MQDTVSAATARTRRPFLSPRARKLVLTVHVISSVGWIGASLCLLALGLTGLLSGDPQAQKAAYMALGVIGTVVTGPVSVLALISGIVISVGTKWGLFRHWWVLISLIATTAMTVAVLFALGPLMRSASTHALAALPGTPVLDAVGGEAVSVVVAPSVAIVVLSVVTGLNVFKPVGRVRRV